MTRIAGIADLHIGATHLTTLEDQELALQHVLDQLVRRRVELLLIAGDLFDSNRPSPAAIAVAGRFFQELHENKIPSVVSRGNHDPSASEIVSFFRGDPHVPAEPAIVRIADVDVAVMPWLPDAYVRAAAGGEASREETAERLSRAAADILAGLRAKRRPGAPLVLVGHFTVAGSETPTGFNMGWRAGVSWVVPIEELEGFDVAVVGHVHRHQAFGFVVVPGSLLPLDFSESQPHGFIVGDAEGASWEFVEIPTPQVATFDVVGVAQAPHDVTVAELVGDAGNYVDAGSLIRVRAVVDEPTARKYPPARIERALLEAGARKVQVELTVEREDRARDAEMTVDLAPLTALGRYLEGRDELAAAARDLVLAAATTAITEVLHDERTAGAGDLRVDSIEVENFLGVAAAHVDLVDTEVGALVGPVGMGKSTLGADAVRFALFGSTRQGARASERIVRAGERDAHVQLQLSAVDGRQYLITRKVRVSPGGRAAQTVDVLASRIDHAPAGVTSFYPWEPLTDGKVASADAAIARILGGLSDRTLTAANLVIQRQGNVFAAARPEERKQLLAEAAGLDLYGDLALLTAKHLNEAERELSTLEAKAEPLRARATAIARVELERAEAELDRDMAAREVEQLERAHTAATELAERAQERAAEREKVAAEARDVQAQIERFEAAVGSWTAKANVAREILAHKPELLEARRTLERARAEIERLEGELAKAQTAARRRAEQLAIIANLERDLETEKGRRQRKLTEAQTSLRVERRRLEELRASGCLENCRHAKACTVAFAADGSERRIANYESDERSFTDKGPRELDYERQVIQVRSTLTPAPDANGISAQLLIERGRAQDLERQTAVAEKIAAAEQVLVEHDEAVAKTATELEPLRRRRGDLNQRLLAFAGVGAEVERARGERERTERELDERRRDAQRAGERVALLAGRLEEMRTAEAELVGAVAAITSGARQVAAWKELVIAWRACRVMVLETSVIPAVEDTANEVLRRFPYGLQLRFATQREKKSGDGLAETLDIEILGGKAPVYELLSGGQATAVDVSLHLAIALVVARRQRTRLQFLYLDEPEGLDQDGRAAFAAIARWCHEAFGLTVLVSSHHEDLIEQLGAQIIRLEGEPGNAHVGAAVDEPEAVTA